MDYNFSWPTVRVDPRLRLSRSLALTGLLRELSPDVPDDAVLFYLVNTDCSGLKQSVFDNLYNSVGYYEGNPTLSQPMKPIAIPDALRKMTNEYFITILVSELYSASWNACDSCFDPYSRAWLFPKKVRDALDRVPITNCATLQDHKVMVDSLRASICNDTIDTSDQSKRYWDCDRREKYWKNQGFDVLSVKQVTKLRQLRDMYSATVNEMRLSRKMPNPYEWSTLCDVLELILILGYNNGFVEASNAYSLYEYAKMAEVGRERTKKFSDPYEVNRLRDLHSASIDRSLDFYSKLSPKAALMIGRNTRLSFFESACGVSSPMPIMSWDDRAIRKYLAYKHQDQSTAVKLFMKYEVAIQRRKIEEISRTIRKHGHACDRCEEGEQPCDCACCG